MKTHSTPPRGRSGKPSFVFVLEESLGHAVHGRNIRRAIARDTQISPTVIRVAHGESAPRMASFDGFLRHNWSVEASWLTRRALKERLAIGPADAVFIHTQVASLLLGTLLNDVPYVLSMDATPINFDSVGHGYGHRTGPAALERLKSGLNKRAFRSAAAIVTWSRWAADSVVEDYGIDPRKVHVIHPGVDVAQFTPRDHDRIPGPLRILFVGGDFSRKGGYDLLKAMQHLGRDAELDIVTSSPPSWLPKGARVHALGHDDPELFGLYARADVFALPARAECFGLVVTEAMASGIPVVACDVGAVAELVVDGHNGLLVPPADPVRLAEALRTLADRPELRRAMGKRGRRMAEQGHDAGRNCAAIIDLLRETASSTRTQARSRVHYDPLTAWGGSS